MTKRVSSVVYFFLNTILLLSIVAYFSLYLNAFHDLYHSAESITDEVSGESRQLYPPDTNLCHELGDGEAAPQFVVDGGFIILIVAVLYALWAISFVCEDFFVPALEVLCRKNDIPDSVAGAIVMAAGNDAPGNISKSDIVCLLVCLFACLGACLYLPCMHA